MVNSKKTRIPERWVWTTLGEIRSEKKQSIVPNKTPYQIFELYSVPNFAIGIPEIVKGKEIGSNKQVVEEDTILLCKINPRINRVWLVGNFSSYQKIASTEWIPFSNFDGLNPKYLCYFLQNNIFRDFLTLNVSGVGGSLMRIKASTIIDYPFPLPPLPEQHRIVERIEQLFTNLDAGVESLKAARTQLKRYRQSVLKSACEGRLVPTEAELARAEGREYEPAEVLLERVLEERRRKWEKNNPKKKYKEPDAPDSNTKSTLPDGWRWATLEQLAWDSGYGTSEKCDYDFSGPPVLRIPNVNEGRIVLNDMKFATDFTNLDEAKSLSIGDLLVIRTNGSKDLIGRAGVVTQNFDKPYFFASYLIRYRIVEYGKLPIWLSCIWHSPRIRSWIERKAATSAGQYNISMSILNKLIIELPPLAEQHRIVAEVERSLSVADEMEKTIARSLKQAERLRQSILKRAFEGKLVPQDPEDEPATVLLERIKVEKEQKEKIKKNEIIK